MLSAPEVYKGGEILLLRLQLENRENIKYKKIVCGEKIMIMIHGNISSGLHFKSIIKCLHNDYTVYITYLRGFGETVILMQ